MSFLLKWLAWTITLMGFTIYGLVILETILHPPAHPSNPIEDFQKHLLTTDPAHLRFNVIAFALIIIWGVAYGYVKKDKNDGKPQ